MYVFFVTVIIIAISSCWSHSAVVGDELPGVTFDAVMTKARNPFPDVIYEQVQERLNSEEANKSAVLEVQPDSLRVPLDRGVVLILQAMTLLESNQNKLASKNLEEALRYLPKESQLAPLAEMHLIEARIPMTKPIESLRHLKNLTKKHTSLGEWKAEQYSLMLDILMAAKSDLVLYKTWDDYEEKVRPAQRSDPLALRLADYLETRITKPSKELISVLESMAAMYPYSPRSRWAFQKLQQFSCAKTPESQRYYPSTWMLSRLASNSVLDEGLKSFVLESIKNPIRTSSGEKKILDVSERVAFLIQARLMSDAAEIALSEAVETSDAGVSRRDPYRRSKALLQLGQVQMRQNEWLKSAGTFSRYLEEFPERAERRIAFESLADSLARLRLHKVAAEIYADLAASPSADLVLRWHHFWNTYLSGDYQEALKILDKPGYVPSRDRGIEGGLDYWRARILEKTGQKSLADEYFKKVLANYGDSFYSIIIQASRPTLREVRVDQAPAIFHDGSIDIKNELEGRDGFAAKILENQNTRQNSVLPTKERLDIDVARTLQKWGQYRLARRLLRTTAWSQVIIHKMFPEMSDLAFSLGDYGFGLKVAALPESPFKRVPSSSKELHEHMGRFNQDWRLMYPLAHERLVVKYADAAGIDPHLALSIMRSESIYDPDARSIVGAQGLMQLMPFTAIRIARLMGDQEFEMNRLHMPELNIGYGSFYLSKLLSYYSGNLLLAVAGYNAGPTHVDRWLSSYTGLETDEFIESIPFKETRRYVKSVLRNFNQYRNIYSGNQALVALPAIPLKQGETELF